MTMATKLLFAIESFDILDPIDQDLQTQSKTFQQRFGDKFTATELQEDLSARTMVINGLFHRILTRDGPPSSTDFQILDLIAPDFRLISGQVHYVSGHKNFHKLHRHVRKNLIWLVDNMTKKAHGTDVPLLSQIYVYLMRQIRGGSLEPDHIAYANDILDLVDGNVGWFTDPHLIRVTVYCFMRLVPDHNRRPDLMQKETRLVNRMLKNTDNFDHCLDIGRDFVHAIQELARISDFDSLWRDMLRVPERLSPRFKSIEQQLMMRPTPVEILNVRLTPNMEQKLYFILEGRPKHVAWTYLNRFKKRYLSTPESEWLIPDIIRYVCSLEFKREVTDDSKYLQRWELIRNLLLSIRSELVAQNAKLALYYDWIFFAQGRDQVFRLEPAAKIMARCAQHPSTMSITSTLLEFLYLMVEEYAPSMRDQIRNHIKQAHSELLDVKVIRTVGEYKVEDDRIQNYTEYLFSGSMLKPIRSLVMENAQTDYEASVRMSINSDFQGSIESSLESYLLKACDSMVTEPDSCKYFQQYLSIYCEQVAKPNPEWINKFQPKISTSLSNFIDHKDDCQIARALVTAIIDYQVPEEKSGNLIQFCGLLNEMNRLFGLALWVELIRQCACDLELRGRMLWFFTELAHYQDIESVHTYFEANFASLFETSLSLFYKVVPIAFTHLPQFCSGNLKMVDLVVKFMDPFGLQTLHQQLLLGTFSLFGTPEQTLDIMESSLCWGTFEQIAIWELLKAECSDKTIAPRLISRTLEIAQADQHPEAIIGLSGFIAQCKLTEALLESVFLCPDTHDGFFHACLTKLYRLFGQHRLEDLLSRVLDDLAEREDRSNGANSQSPLRSCLTNMKKWKEYWNTSDKLQEQFPLTPFSDMRNLSQILPSFRLDPDLYSLLPASDSIVYGEERSMDGSSRDSGRSMYNSTENLLPTPPPASSMNGGSGRSSSYYPQLPQQSQYRQQDQQQSYQQQEYHQRRGSQERYRSPSSDRREYHGASPSSRYQDRPRERR